MANVLMHGEGMSWDGITAGSANFYVPDPETSPEAIAADQRVAVSAAYSPGMTPEEISDRVDLPVWNVRRCLADLGLAPPLENEQNKVFAERNRKHRAKKRIIALLTDGRAMTCHEIGQRLKMDPEFVKRIVVTSDDFASRPHQRERRKGGGTVQLWTVTKGEPCS